MKTYNITETKAQLSAIIAKLMKDGQDVVIERMGEPVAVLKKIDDTQKKKRVGWYTGKMVMAEDFDEWPDDIKKYWE